MTCVQTSTPGQLNGEHGRITNFIEEPNGGEISTTGTTSRCMARVPSRRKAINAMFEKDNHNSSQNNDSLQAK